MEGSYARPMGCATQLRERSAIPHGDPEASPLLVDP
jgi:hypothetical protein